MADETVVRTAEITRRHWSEADARAVIEAWRESGQSIAQYARSRSIHPERLARWERKLRSTQSQTLSFHPVRVTHTLSQRGIQSEPLIEVVLGNDRRVRVPHGFAPQDLRAVLAVLEERS